MIIEKSLITSLNIYFAPFILCLVILGGMYVSLCTVEDLNHRIQVLLIGMGMCIGIGILL